MHVKFEKFKFKNDYIRWRVTFGPEHGMLLNEVMLQGWVTVFFILQMPE